MCPFIHSPVRGHLACFYSLPIVNKAAMNMKVHISFLVSSLSPLDKDQKVELLGHMVVLFLIF